MLFDYQLALARADETTEPIDLKVCTPHTIASMTNFESWFQHTDCQRLICGRVIRSNHGVIMDLIKTAKIIKLRLF